MSFISLLSSPASRGLLALMCAAGPVACGDKSGDGPTKDPTKDPTAAIATAVEKSADDAIAEAGGAHLFDPEDKALRKRACEFLTADMIAGLFDVPATELKQMQVMGCLYNWKRDDEVLNAHLMMIRVHRDRKLATTWFDNATATQTKAQLEAQMDTVKGKVKDRDELDTKLKKNTAGSMVDIAKMGMPDDGVSYDDVPGVGDAARVSNADGVMWVRLRNMTFQVSAYKGTKQPTPKFDPKNIKGIAKAAMEAQKQWTKETLAQRKQAVQKLAPRVVAAISAAI